MPYVDIISGWSSTPRRRRDPGNARPGRANLGQPAHPVTWGPVLIIAIILVGMLAGAAAQLVFRSRKRPIDWTAAIVVGLIGSFVGGLIFSLIAGDGLAIRPSGLIGSIVGAIVVAGVYKLATGRAPGDRPHR